MTPRPGTKSVVSRPLSALALALGLCLLPAGALAQGKGKRGKGDEPPPARVKEKQVGKRGKAGKAGDQGARVREKGKKGKKGKKEKLFDFTGLQLDASMRMPQLLYFLDRANEELKRASLERRSFVPEMVRSVEEGPL